MSAGGGALKRWHVGDVAPDDRLDLWVSALRAALIPIYVRRADAACFEFDMSAAQLGPIGVLRQHAQSHHCGRGRSELAQSRENSFNLLMSLDCSYGFTHRGELDMRAGDLTLHFSEYPFELAFASSFRFVNLSLPDAWVRTWLPNPQALVGRRIGFDSPWGRALSSFARLLSPEYAADPPIAHAVLIDQLGSLMTLASQQFAREPGASPKAERSLRERILTLVDERCHEEALCARDVAECLGVSVRTVHRALGQADRTFGAMLIEARVERAVRMLQSPAFNRLTIAEIGRRAGFSDASHFSRATRSRRGLTPRQLRSLRAGTASPGG